MRMNAMDRSMHIRRIPAATPEPPTPAWMPPLVTPRRRSAALPLVHATVGQCLSSFGTWPVRSLNAQAAFLEMQGPRPAVGTRVDVSLRHQWHGVTVEHRLLAVVTQSSGEGLLLAFCDCTDAQRTSLAALANPPD